MGGSLVYIGRVRNTYRILAAGDLGKGRKIILK
jgi:hypothetical protein